jgi:hypothetical protein
MQPGTGVNTTSPVKKGFQTVRVEISLDD